jgi:hypothetical protein
MIVVLTTNRPGSSYLEETCRQIESSARRSKVILVDGKESVTRNGWLSVAHARPVVPPQNKWTAWEAFRLAVEAKEDLVFFEDDLELCVNAASYIEDFPVPEDLAFVTFYSPWVEKAFPIGIVRVHAHSYVMAQALKFPLRTAEELWRYRFEPIWKEASGVGGFDEILRYLAIKKTWRYGIFNPGIVQHVGANSVVGNGGLVGMRVARNYAGKDYDANGLRRCPPEFFS